MHKELITKLITYLDIEQDENNLNGYTIQYEKKMSEVIILRLFPPFNLELMHKINILVDVCNFDSSVGVSSEIHPYKQIVIETVDISLKPNE